MPNNQIQKPWYRQLWPWMLIAIPFSSVMGGALMIYLAVIHPANLVKDSYYQDGMGINKHIEKDLIAAERGIEADIRFDEPLGDVTVDLRGAQERALVMELFHPTDNTRDMISKLSRTVERQQRYQGHFQPPLAGRWYVELRDADNQWRMRGRLVFPVNGMLEMRPAAKQGSNGVNRSN